MAVPESDYWHALPESEVLSKVESSELGLSESQASERLQRDGYNRLNPASKRPWLLRFAQQFHNLLIYVLLVAAIVTSIVGHWVDTSVIIAVVVINALIGVVQEGKAEKALEAIRDMLSHQAMAKRDGSFNSINADELVLGDWVRLQPGDKVPADIRLFRTHNLQCDEALLTGESLPVDKHPGFVARELSLGDRTCMLYSGALITRGQGEGVVVATGEATELGRISALLKSVSTLITPLLRQLEQFARWLTVGILALALVMFVFGWVVREYGILDLFLAAVGLAVAAIPEGLPAIMTITLAIGVQHMARREAIIRRLPAVETLGSVTVICSDKTGTLTRNEMTARALVTRQHLIEITGSGYDLHGVVQSAAGIELELESEPWLGKLLRVGVLCNDTVMLPGAEGKAPQGDPMEAALMVLAYKSGLDVGLELQEWQRLDLIPFESQHRLMATLEHNHSGQRQISVKGAPESLLDLCTRQAIGEQTEPLNREYWEEQLELLACQGMRVLAVAHSEVSELVTSLHHEDLQQGLVFLGLIGFIDPPRSEAIHAVRLCQQAGISVKMITGDHLETAKAIGRMLGMSHCEAALSGSELEALSPEELQLKVQQVDIFARTSPEHKLRLVEALQAKGEVVAMTGDGVNDAPALKRADVGIAMGIKGTEVTKEAAEMVLTDDNFASIEHAIEQGRTVYDNLKKAILFILPTNGAQALSIMAAVVLGRQLPITPVQILWVNMVTAVTLALALAFEPSESKIMERPPRPAQEPLLSGFLLWRILLVSIILVSGTFGLFVWYRIEGAEIELARTVAVNTLVTFEIFYLFNARYFLQCSLSYQGFFENRYALLACGLLILLQLLFTYSLPMQQMFDTRPLDWVDWGRILIITSSVLWLVELEKALLRHFFKN
ncbi:cation-transporting P-type ATPase [Dongshaea marina]|uniref:cation-transporting P-type ATPase n=1 Tax=Dongshaea marina TaxID=2047966 RepID=UPI000D3E16D1|nr:cation-transporting P-type ATPase [Dongshaea marina]